MALVGQQLDQMQPTASGNEWYIATGVTNLIDIAFTSFKLANFSDEEILVDIYHDSAGGSTWDNTTIIYAQIRLLPLRTRDIKPAVWFSTNTEQLGIKASSASKINATVYGQIRTS